MNTKTTGLLGRLSIFVMTALGVTLSASINADPVSDFYKDKQLTLLIGYGVGGGYDQYARVLARHMGKHIPGNPILVPQNMPGAGSRKAASYLYAAAPKDGTVIATVGQNTPMDQVLRDKGIKFDVRKFNWIGNMVTVNNTVTAWHTSGANSLQDVIDRELVVGASGASSPSVLYPQVMNNLLNTKFRIIAGYPGGGAINLAMERGEVGGRGSNSWASWKSTKQQWLSEKKINILVQVGAQKDPDLPNVPLLIDLAKNDEDRAVLRIISSGVLMGRPFVAPPGVPEDRVAALRRAFDATMKDPEFLAEAEKSKMRINPSSGEEVQQTAASVVNTPANVIAKTKQAIEKKDIIKTLKKKKKK